MTDRAAEGLTVVLPVFNQAGALDKALAAWFDALHKIDRPIQFIALDDGSTDDTAKLLDAWAAKKPLQVLRHETRQGYGACLREALTVAGQPLVATAGLDDRYHPSDLKRLLQRISDCTGLDEGVEIGIVNGTRPGVPLPGGRRFRSKLWHAFLRVFVGLPYEPRTTWLGPDEEAFRRKVRFWFGVHVKDVNSRFKLIRRKLFARMPIQSAGDFVHAEILAKANFLGCLIDEVPLAASAPFAPSPEPRTNIAADKRLAFKRPDFGPTFVPAERTATTTPARAG